jgi:hypothetical protein
MQNLVGDNGIAPRDGLDQMENRENDVPESPIDPPSPSPSPPPANPPSPSSPPDSPPPPQLPHRSTRFKRSPQPYWITQPAMAQYREPTPVIPSSGEEESSSESTDDQPQETGDKSDEDPELSYGKEEESAILLSVLDAFELAYKVAAHDDSPKSLSEALRSPDADK